MFAVLLADIENGADVRMVEAGSGFGFAAESLERRRSQRCFGRKEFEGDESMEAVSSALQTTPIPRPPSFSRMR
jgi:hypothetical protein